MKVTFKRLTEQATAVPSLYADSPVALFDLEDGREMAVLYRDLTRFQDLKVGHWPPRLRAEVILGLCAEVVEAPVVVFFDNPTPVLFVDDRFGLSSGRGPAFAQSLARTDARIIRLLVRAASGKSDPDAQGLPGDPAQLLAQLRSIGVPHLDQPALVADEEPAEDLSLYADLDRGQLAACIRLLAPQREAFLKNVAIRVHHRWPPKMVGDLDDQLTPRQLRAQAKLGERMTEQHFEDLEHLSREERLRRSLPMAGARAIHHQRARAGEARYLLSDDELRAKESYQLLGAALWPGWEDQVDKLNGAEASIRAAGQNPVSPYGAEARAVMEVLDSVDAMQMSAAGLAALGKEELAKRVDQEVRDLVAEIFEHPLALEAVREMRQGKLNTSLRPRTSAWNLVPREEDGQLIPGADPLFAEAPLTEDELVMVAYGSSDPVTEARVIDSIAADPRLKARYDELLGEAELSEEE